MFYESRKTTNYKLVLSNVSEEFIYKELCQLNTGKSTGLDGIPARFLKDAAKVLKIPITFIINLSISSHTVPDDLKLAKVKPLFKKNDRLKPENYRPVSILSIVSKLLEKAIYKQLENFLVENNLLYEFQSGFRKSYSTDSCLIHLVDYIKLQTAKGLFTGMVLLDLQKAFDTVDHEILCQKLEVLGVHSIEWFRSYLTNRKQLVNVNSCNSDVSNISCGVPQGSLLGPLLFLIYVNDMQVSIDSDCKVLLYADDSCILFSHRDPEVISSKLSKMLEQCHDWLVDNKLSLHLGKTESILFGPSRKVKCVGENSFNISCHGFKIEMKTCVKYLGVMLDNMLSGELIVQNIITKVNQRLKFLYRNSKCLSMQSRKTLCSALIQCHLDYASCCWYEGISKKLKSKLQVAQNKVVRFILSLHCRHSVGFKEFRELDLLPIPMRVKQLRLNHVHNIVSQSCPSYLAFNFNKKNTTHSTRSGDSSFYVPSVKGGGGGESSTFYYNGIKDWNSLPLSVRNLESKQKFKSEVKKVLFLELENAHNHEFVM